MGDFYIYAYIDPRDNEPFYIGKGYGDRAWRHVRRPSYYKTRNSFFYCKLRKMLKEGITPAIVIVKAGLTENVAYEVESMLIHLVGMRAAKTGPLCNLYVGRRGASSGFTLERGTKQGKAIEAWGEMFPSLTAITRDPRCMVKRYETLQRRMKKGLSIEDAATIGGPVYWSRPPKSPKPPQPPKVKKPRKGKKVICWGEEFISGVTLCRDPRCVVSSRQLTGRLRRGWNIERAATTSINLVAARKT